MMLNFLKYSTCITFVVLSVVNTLRATEDEDMPSLKRTRTELGSSRSSVVGFTNVLKAGDNVGQEDGLLPLPLMRQTSSQRTDSQHSHNKYFDHETIYKTKKRYKDLFTANPDEDTETELDEPKKEETKSVSAKKVGFRGRVSVRACSNEVGQKKTASFAEYLIKKIPNNEKKRKQKRLIRASMEQEWKSISEIKNHLIFNYKFQKALNKIEIGFKKLKEVKLIAINDGSLNDVLDNFFLWEEVHLNPAQILNDLETKLSEFAVDDNIDSDQFVKIMDEEHKIHMDALSAKRQELIVAKFFDDCVPADISTGEAGNNAGSIDSVLYFQDKTDLQYFDWLVERYSQALITFKEDLLRLQNKEMPSQGKRGIKRKDF